MKKPILVVIFVAIVMMILALSYSVAGNFNSTKPANSAASITNALNSKNFQEVSMELSYSGYSPNTLYIKKEIPVRWNIDVKQMTGCTSAIMIEALGIKKNLQIGNNTIEFTPPAGIDEIKFSCGMKMVWGKFIVTEDGIKPANAVSTASPSNSQENSKGCGCGCGQH